MCERRLTIWLLLLGTAFCTAMLPARAAAQSPERATSARIAGRVVEADGTPLPRVIVQLEGPAPGTGSRQTTAGADARFLFEGLLPGTYRIAVQLPGLEAPADVEVTVQEGEEVEVDVELSLFAYEASVQVVARAARDDVFGRDSTANLAELSNSALVRLPLPAEQAIEVLPLFPGVVRGPSGLISIGGSLPTDSAFLLNGADMIDTYSGAYNLNVPLEAVQGIQLFSGVFAAAYGENLGGVVDLTTMPGGEEWGFEIGSVFPRPWFNDGQLAGVRRFNPRARISGPLIENRVRMSLAGEYRFNRERVFDTPDDRGDNMPSSGWDGLAQIDWSPNSRHDVRFVMFARPQGNDLVGLGGLTPEETTSSTESDTAAAIGEHEVRLDDRSFVQSFFSWNRTAFATRPTDPIEGTPLYVIPDGFRGRAFDIENRRVSHYQFKSLYGRAIGTDEIRHVLQAGIDVHYLTHEGATNDGPIEIRGVDGDLLQRTVFSGPTQSAGSKWEASVFVQDRWRPSPRFWIDAGLRATWDGATRNSRLAPRVGVAWVPFDHERTVLKASAGVLYRRVFLGEQLWDQLPSRVETTYVDGQPVDAELLVPRIGDDLDAPRALLTEVQVSHRLTDAVTARVRYAKRDTRKQIIFDRVPADDGTTSLLLHSEGRAFHDEIELTANLRLGDTGQLFLSYVHSRGEGDLNTFSLVAGQQPDAVLRPSRRGPLASNTPHRLIAWGLLDLPWDLRVAPVIEWRTGFPYSVYEEDQSYAGAPNTERFPSYLSADVNITKGLRFLGQSTRLGVQVQNLTGRFNPREVIANRASPRFGEFLNSEPLRLRVRFSASF